MSGTPNRYLTVSLDAAEHELPIDGAAPLGWGRDFYVDVFRELERDHGVRGLVVYIVYRPPRVLSTVGANVVLVIVGDEFHRHRAYYRDVGCILRCYGASPVYRDGLPTSRLKLAALAAYLRKRVLWALSAGTVWRSTGRLGVAEAARKTLQVPLGTFGRFEPVRKPMAERGTDYAFLGSVAFDAAQLRLAHRLMPSPKVLSRELMLRAAATIAARFRSRIRATGDFEQSIASPEVYVTAMADTRISLVPRGTCYETYRFFESMKAGCIVVCEPQPDVWCYAGHPGIVVDDWRELPALVAALLADEAGLARRSAASLHWWRDCASEAAVARRVAAFLRRTLSPNYAGPITAAVATNSSNSAIDTTPDTA